MTGHQVYSSLHTNDALGAIPRLMNMGVPNYLMAGSLICVVAQRLARKLCPHCKKEQPITDYEKKLLGPKYDKIEKLYSAVGCDKCGNAGYKSRVVVCELLPFDRDLDELVVRGASKKEMLQHVLSRGFIPMIEDGVQKVVAGIIDLKELTRVVDMTERMA